MPKKGYKQSEEHKRKIGLTNSVVLAGHPGYWLGKIRVLPESHRKRIGLSNTGKKRSVESIENYRNSNNEGKFKKGDTLSEERRLKISLGHKGERNYNWKGGITPIKTQVAHSIKYKGWRMKVFERDSYTCQECRIIGGTLNADHVRPFSFIFKKLVSRLDRTPTLEEAMNYSELWDVSNGRTLCVPCHRKTKTYGLGAIKYNESHE